MSTVYPPQNFVTSQDEICVLTVQEIPQGSSRSYVMHDNSYTSAASEIDPNKPTLGEYVDNAAERSNTFRGEGLADVETRKEAAQWLCEIAINKDGSLPVDVNLYQQLPQDGSFESVKFGLDGQETERIPMSRAEVEVELLSELRAPKETEWMQRERYDAEQEAAWEKSQARTPEERAKQDTAEWQEIDRVHKEAGDKEQKQKF
jgi:hypothetical protein